MKRIFGFIGLMFMSIIFFSFCKIKSEKRNLKAYYYFANPVGMRPSAEYVKKYNFIILIPKKPNEKISKIIVKYNNKNCEQISNDILPTPIEYNYFDGKPETINLYLKSDFECIKIIAQAPTDNDLNENNEVEIFYTLNKSKYSKKLNVQKLPSNLVQ